MAVKDVTTADMVDRFLSTGSLGSLDPSALAAACDSKVRAETQISTESSIRLGRQFVKQSKLHGGVLYCTALRALGWAQLVAGRYRDAEKNYLSARSLLSKDAAARARIDRVLIDVYMYLGRFDEAQRRARSALSSFIRLKADADIAKTRVNYANLLHRQDRHRQARRLYEEAAAYFEGEGAKLAVALCHYNLANTLVQLMEFAPAEQLYSRARETFTRHASMLHATGCLYGLAWLHMLQGDFHTALQELSDCETEYQKGKQLREQLLCQLDRAEVYLGLNLLVDARDAARQATKMARKLGITYELAKAEFFFGKASVAIGRAREARNSLKRAEQGFRRENNQGFGGAAQLTLAQLDRPGQAKINRMRAARKRFARAQLPLWEAICDLQILAVRPDESQARKRLGRNPAVRTVPHLMARHLALLGDREAGRRRMRAAVGHWSKAADILDAVRAKLPPVDLRSAFLSNQSDPYRKLVEAEHQRDPLTAAVWSERFKTVGLWSTSEDIYLTNPARRKAESSLSQLAGQVTAVSQMISDKSRRRAPSTLRQGDAFSRLQRNVRRDLAILERGGGGVARHEELAASFRRVSAEQPIVQFHVGLKDIFAFVHYRGECRAHRYLDGVRTVRELVALWRFTVERSPANRRPGRADLKMEDEILHRVGRWLLPPLELPSAASRLLILPEGQLASLPWPAITENGASLVDRFAISFAPSLRHHLHAQGQTTRSSKTNIYVGASEDLTHLRDEIDTVSLRFQGKDNTVYDPCRRADWPDNSSAKIWHFTGHAHLRSDNPFYSALLLADGPLFAADFRLKRNRVELITLAACRTGQQTSLPGEEAGGLVRSLLEMGAHNVIASHWAVSDLSTSLWSDLLYKSYLDGASAGEAVRRAALGVREKFPSAYHWGAFSVFGAG